MDCRLYNELLYTLDTLKSIRFMHRMLSRNRLSRLMETGPESLGELKAAIDRILAAFDAAYPVIDRVSMQMNTPFTEHGESHPQPDFTAEESAMLARLSQGMNVISQFMHQTAEAIRPEMAQKAKDNTDPLFDFEIEAKIDYQLRKDDPEFEEDSDNYLSSRTESLRNDDPAKNQDWRYSRSPEPLRNQPMSWLLHSLLDHHISPEERRMSIRDCLRIGEVHLDIQVWWQYIFDVETGQWAKRYDVRHLRQAVSNE